jgi:cation:H+ antiporter
MIAPAVVAVVAGLVVLAVMADQFVIGAARLAAVLRVSPVVIGAVVIGFGTSAPELTVSGLAAGQGDPDLGVGNVLGSNIANLTLVLGVAALITVIRVSSRTLRREAPLSVASCVVFAIVVRDGITTIEGVGLLVLLACILGSLVVDGRRQGDRELIDEIEDYVGEDGRVRLGVEVARTAAGLAGTLVAAQLLVWGAGELATELGLSDGFVGLAIVALGTSLPELVTAVQAARRGEDELIVGNLLGSNIFNSLAVGGVLGLAGASDLHDATFVRDASLLMVAIAVAAWAFMARGSRVVRWEALLLLGSYVVAVPLLTA